MIIFKLLMINKIWERRFEKLSHKDQESVYMFFVYAEMLIAWFFICLAIIGR